MLGTFLFFVVYYELGVACRILIGKPEERRQLGKFSLSWEDNIKTYVKKRDFF